MSYATNAGTNGPQPAAATTKKLRPGSGRPRHKKRAAAGRGSAAGCGPRAPMSCIARQSRSRPQPLVGNAVRVPTVGASNGGPYLNAGKSRGCPGAIHGARSRDQGSATHPIDPGAPGDTGSTPAPKLSQASIPGIARHAPIGRGRGCLQQRGCVAPCGLHGVGRRRHAELDIQ